MANLIDGLAPVVTLPRLQAQSKRQALQTMADALAEATGLDGRMLFDSVLMRERVSGTGVGEGVAIPHARAEGLAHPVGCFARLDPAIDFEALDGRPADLVFLLVSPDGHGADHLKALAKVSRFLRRAEVREKLRSARSADALAAIFASSAQSDAA